MSIGKKNKNKKNTLAIHYSNKISKEVSILNGKIANKLGKNVYAKIPAW